ncbi:patatin-like phospholipase family protein [Pseudonocardia sp. WMMC193]|uniref:patatin-like phospholipase family protein n=1 Tax=Pseudonocardia sp. WMMC193 TaxID=2911965 RepID=UPI001F00774D|nr:patatin-like phospholipase family protein [Pseudonocardia sp. WMMC193]MCF7547875.1 patatin-like phospholipase family protein [Pseudonocardia sp. WMMC193]
MTVSRRPRRVAIACQGGGSHTAFTAGVLGGLLEAEELRRYEVVGLSGTSGGAICALLAWQALTEGDRAGVGRRLERFWRDNAARGLVDRMANAALVSAGVLQNLDLFPGISPYLVPKALGGADVFRALVSRHVDFEAISTDREGAFPLLVLGAVDVLSGRFRAFHSRRDRIGVDSVLASAAIPQLFRAVRTGGGTYWDGLFSQNPPVRDLLEVEPDEIWVIQINPTAIEHEPRTIVQIADRRNELAGNLSLYQELAFIEQTDRLLDEGRLRPGGPFRHVVVRVLELPRRVLPRRLGPASKMNRDDRFLRRLIAEGRAQADRFIGALEFERAFAARDATAILALAAPGATLLAEPPFPPFDGRERDPAKLHAFVSDLLTRDLRIDSSRKQIAQDRVTWTLRLSGEGRAEECVAQADFQGRRITHLRLARA